MWQFFLQWHTVTTTLLQPKYKPLTPRLFRNQKKKQDRGQRKCFYKINLSCRCAPIRGGKKQDIKEVQKKTHDLHAVSVCGLVVEGGNYLLIFGLGGVVTHRVHKLQRGGREAFVRSVCVYVCTWWMRAG